METKICGQCGKTYERPYGMSRSQFATRKYCSMQCRAEAAHTNRPNANPRIWEGRFRERECECGAPATETIWVIQFGADDTPARQYIECCADCRDLFLETDPGATLEKPERPRWEEYNRYAEDCAGNDYHAPAHLVSWHMRKGARP